MVPWVSKLADNSCPVQDSPRKPSTPRAPQDIALARTNPVPLEGRWSEYSGKDKFSGRKAPVFSPQSINAAKSYLSRGCPPRPPRSPTSTPLTSRAPVWSRERSASSTSAMVCHGCHGVRGSNQHKGSVLGKDRCILPHASTCPGGVLEDDNWRACPTGYAPG